MCPSTAAMKSGLYPSAERRSASAPTDSPTRNSAVEGRSSSAEEWRTERPSWV